MAQQTAVDWLFDQLTPSISLQQKYIDEYREQANKMFEQQIIKAVDVGFDEGCKFPEDIKLGSGDQYYKETYGK
jgi:hypothetical protein